ncbi:DUF4129 domain-containing protein [Natronoarchaeum rubrum]|uniref:DUF4129 domain-containing protein n=1 Tax=Natronoarchaeum rubrum TaxID=755311 RepID=UPI002112AD51|nr:DUF4129 domain-containing protein [Natronoarchaeum rubrum]
MTDESSSDGRVGPDLTRAAVVACCILGLVLVAGFLPAVDQVDDADTAGIGTDERAEDPADDGAGDGSGEDDDPASREISVAGTTPGQEMRVTVRSDGDPVSDAAITVDGDQVGSTGDTGALEVFAPYESSVNVSASASGWTESERVALSTDVDVTRRGVDAEAGTLTIAATIDDESLPGASVTVDGEQVAETGDNGVAKVPLPADDATVDVRRGAAEGAASIDTDDVGLAVEGAWFVPKLPLGPATARVDMDGVPVRNAPVTVDGERVGTTDDGKTRFRLPAADSATIGTEVRGESASSELDGLVFGLAWSVLGALSLLIGIVIMYLRAFDLQTRRQHRLRIGSKLSLDGLWPSGVLSGVGAAVTGIPAAIGRTAGAVASLFGRLGGGVGWLSQFTGALRLPRFALPSLPSLSGLSALSLLPSLDRGSRSIDGDDDDGEPADRDETARTIPDEPAIEAEDDSAPTPTVRRAWHRLVDRLGVARRETRTPGQIARRAIDAGYPDDAVDRLTGAFRDVEYGGRSESDDRVQAAYDALDRIRSEEDDES